METVIINSDKIKQAIDKYMGNDVKLFEIFVGKSIYSFTKTHFNAVVFDMDKFENIFKYGDDYKEYIGLSLKDSILKKYGEVILYIFEDKIISNPFMAIGVITE